MHFRQGQLIELQSGQGLPMCLKKSFPRYTAPSFRRRFDPIVIKNSFYRVSVHGDTKGEQRIPNPCVSPGGVFVRHSHREICDSVALPGPPGAALRRPIVFLGDKVPEPTQKRVRRDDSGELVEGPSIPGPSPSRPTYAAAHQ